MNIRHRIAGLSWLLAIALQSVAVAQPRETVLANLPEALQNLPRLIDVAHFPEEVHPIEDAERAGLYHWKHNTAVVCTSAEINILEFGAYIYYSDQWNLRVKYLPKDMDKIFRTKKALMLQAQPYTFVDNWRSGTQVSPGWAMWYFIGKTKQGERVCGYKELYTTAKILEK